MATVPRKLKWLVAVHLVIATAPAALALVPADPLSAILISPLLIAIPVSQIMLIAFWLGMGTSRASGRWLGSLLASAYLYLTLWPPVNYIFSLKGSRHEFVSVVVVFFIIAAIIEVYGGAFWLIRWWVAGMMYFPEPPSIPRTRLQFSIFQLVLITSAVAVALGLMRIGLLVFVTLLVPLAVPWATLCMGSVGRRIILVLGMTLLLAIAVPLPVNIVVPLPEWWWLFAAETLSLTLPIAIMVLSLLVVRSCGYRLVAEARERDLPAAGASGPVA
jgi:hypothetical protein